MRLWIWNYWQQPWNPWLTENIWVLQNDPEPNKEECLTWGGLRRNPPQVLQAFIVSLGTEMQGNTVYLNILLGFNDANQKL